MGHKYYKKRRSSSQASPEEAFIAIVILVVIYAVWMIQKNVTSFVNTHPKEVILYSYIAMGVFIVLIVLGWFFWMKNKKKKAELLEWLIGEVVAEISEFKPLKRYRDEMPYQMELAWYLRKTFPTLSIEESKGWTRPDIIVEDIAIEIKWPTGNGELRTIADKIIRYLKHYDKLIVVLFALEVPDKQYSEWKEDIQNTFENKKDKLFILEI